MSAVLLAPAPRRSATPSVRRATAVLGYAVVLAGAFLLRLHLLTHGAGLTGSNSYDDGVYYAAADALVHGRLPYRDFLLLHPPGIALTLAPFAALGSAAGDHIGVGVARLAFLAVATAGVGLVMLLARRHSRSAAITAGVVAAVWFPLAYGDRSTCLEPLGGFLVLAATAVTRRPGRLPACVGGLLAGAAVMVKIWYAAPLVVLVLLLPRRRLPFTAGVAGAIALIAGPFFAAAPADMLREVVLDQLGRPRLGGLGLRRRLTTILADPFAPTRSLGQVHGAQVVAALIGVLLAVAVVALWRHRWARIHAVQAAVAVLVLLAGPSFFLHYAAFTGPWIALCLGIGAASLAARIPHRLVRRDALALLCVAVVAANAPAALHTWARPEPVRQLRAVLAAQPGCIVSDDPGLLANSDALTRNLAAGCELWPDVTGWTYDRDAVRGVGRRDDLRWQRHLMGYLRSGDLLILNRSATGLSEADRHIIDGWPVVARLRHVVVRRDPGRVADGAAVRSR